MLGLRILRCFGVKIPPEKLITSFARSSGPGGQNVNKVNTKADVRVQLEGAKWLSEETIERAKELYPNFVNKEGELFTMSQSTSHAEFRTQADNLRDATSKLQSMLDEASKPVAKRTIMPVKETPEQKQYRIRLKRRISAVKNIKNERF